MTYIVIHGLRIRRGKLQKGNKMTVKQINEVTRNGAPRTETNLETTIGVVTVIVTEALNNSQSGMGRGGMMRRVNYKLNGKRIAYTALVKAFN